VVNYRQRHWCCPRLGVHVQFGSVVMSVANTQVAIPGSTREFVLLGLASLKVPVVTTDQAIYHGEVPENLPLPSGGSRHLSFTFDGTRATEGASSAEGAHAAGGPAAQDRAAAPVRLATPGTPLFEWLIERLHAAGPVLHAAPAAQPQSVHDVSSKLFSYYTVENGHVHLAGCHLEDRPLLRITLLAVEHDEAASERLRHIYFDPSNEPVEPATLNSLHADDLIPSTRRTTDLDPLEIDRWIDAAKRSVFEQLPSGKFQVIAATLVWIKYAEGKLDFEIGEESVGVAFAGWAAPLAEGSARPPSYVCPLTGKSSYRLAATSDGRITVAEAIGTCEASQTRVLSSELETCEVTGQKVTNGFLTHCPVSGKRVLRTKLASCNMCGQQVGPHTLYKGRCAACRGVSAVHKDEPRVARVLGQFPKLDRWRGWKIAETAQVYVLTAVAGLTRLLLVLDKHTLEPLRVCTASRLLAGWSELSQVRQKEILGQ
jgi:hypothetical protein